MSPEQLDADPNDIDVRSDVYALGVVLYELLAGKPPYDVKKKAVYEVMRIVKEEDPTPLSSLNKTLRRDVAVIAGKCLEKDRGRRYSTASELSSDISRYLAGEAILAAPPSFWNGLARLARRHRAAAVAVMGIALSLVAAVVGVSAFAIRAERARLEAQNAREVAVNARKQAESLVDFLTFDLRHRLSSLGRLDLMKPIAEALRQYHAARVGDSSNSAGTLSAEDLRRQAASYVALGDIARDTGDVVTATAHYTEASSLLKRRAATAAMNPPDTVELAETHAKLAASLRWAGDFADSTSHYETALKLLTPISTLEQDNTSALRILSSVHQGLDEAASSGGQPSDSPPVTKHAEHAYDISVRLAARNPANKLLQRDLAVAGMKLGERLAATGDRGAAITHFTNALAICEKLASVEPANADAEHSLWACYDLLGTALRKEGDLASARIHLERAKALGEQRIARDPSNANYQRELAISLVSLGDVHARLEGEAMIAAGFYGRALEILQQLAEKDPSNRVYQENVALAAWRVGVVAMDSSQWERAEECFQLVLNTNTTSTFPFLKKARVLAEECQRRAIGQREAENP